jgi:GNAT superfamily N-acetyltransferase
VNVREARLDDTEVVASLLDEASRWVGERGFEQWPLPFPRAQVAEAIARGEVFLAELDGEPVATVTILTEDPQYWGARPPDALYVHKLAVAREHAGRGFGTEVIGWADRRAVSLGRQFLRLDCLGDSSGIRRYYEQLGFEHRGDLVQGNRNMCIYERPVGE